MLGAKIATIVTNIPQMRPRFERRSGHWAHSSSYRNSGGINVRNGSFATEPSTTKINLCPLFPADSTDQRNTGVKSLCWCLELQGLPWSFVELTRYFV
jgi:hypothetical protein